MHAVDGSVVLEAYAAAECEETERLGHYKPVENLHTHTHQEGRDVRRGGEIFPVARSKRDDFGALLRSDHLYLSINVRSITFIRYWFGLDLFGSFSHV